MKGNFECPLSSDGTFTFRIEDGTSKVRVIEVSIAPGDMILALTGRGFLPCDFTLPPAGILERVGQTFIVKTVHLPDKQAWKDMAGFKWTRNLDEKRDLGARFRGLALCSAVECLPPEERHHEWILSNDGVNDRQDDSQGWRVSLKRFSPLPIPEPTPDQKA